MQVIVMTCDNYYLHLTAAVEMAKQSKKDGYAPVGALLTNDSEIIAQYRSEREIGGIFHAEFRAILDYQEKLKTGHAKQEKLTLYTVLEPCLMCASVAIISKVQKIVWLVDDHWGGAMSTLNLKSDYLNRRMPFMVKANYPDLFSQSIQLWIEHLRETNYEQYIDLILGEQADASYS